MQADIDAANAEFWDCLCGTSLAFHHGIRDRTPESLRRFDEEYFRFYPYLLPIVDLQRMRGKKILDIGLGFGSLGQKLAEVASDYTGLDIAANPVKMMNHRLETQGLPGRAVQGNSLNMPFADASFDHVVSIGCFHHTGDLRQCINETHRVLRPGGAAVLMVYNQFSFRQWTRWPGKTLAAFFGDLLSRKRTRERDERQNAAYDADLATVAKGAPETEFLSIRQLRNLLKDFGTVKFMKRNCDDLLRYRSACLLQRKQLLPVVGPLLGLDIYMEARKQAA